MRNRRFIMVIGLNQPLILPRNDLKLLYWLIIPPLYPFLSTLFFKINTIFVVVNRDRFRYLYVQERQPYRLCYSFCFLKGKQISLRECLENRKAVEQNATKLGKLFYLSKRNSYSKKKHHVLILFYPFSAVATQTDVGFSLSA